MDWVAVVSYGTLFEAEVAAGRLESADIPSRVDQGANAGLFGAGHAAPIGGVSVLVPETEVGAAREALDLEPSG